MLACWRPTPLSLWGASPLGVRRKRLGLLPCERRRRARPLPDLLWRIHNAVRGHARSPTASALRAHARNVSIRTTIRTDTGKYMPIHAKTYPAPLCWGPAAPIRVRRGGQKGHHTRAVPSRTGAPNIKARRRFTAEWLYELPPYKAIASNTSKGYWHYSSLHARVDG